MVVEPTLPRIVGLAAATWLFGAAAFNAPAAAGALPLLSTRDPSVPLPAGGNGDSVAPVLSPDGRFVLFVSAANDLVTGGNSQIGLNVFLRDRTGDTMSLVSANLSGTGGGNGSSTAGGVSSDGRYVVFESLASDLLPGDTNGVGDVFVRDLVAGTTTLVSVATNGGFGNGASSEPVITPDGRYVAFASAARNLTSGILATPNVFVRDLVAATTVLVSVGWAPGGASPRMATPAITPDGRFVAFFSTALGLVPGSVQNAGSVFVRDLLQGQTTLVNVPPSNAYHPVISDDGRYVAYKTSTGALLRFDSVTGVSGPVIAQGVPWGDTGDAYGPEMTPDGRFLTFVFYEGNSGTGIYSSVHVWDGQTGADTLISVAKDGSLPASTTSQTPAITLNGRFVVFVSNATNLVDNTISTGSHIYLRDLQAGTTRLVDVDTNGIGSTDNEGNFPTLSADGRFVAFCSLDGSLASGDNNHAYDVFVRDMVGGQTELISKRDSSVVPNAGSALSSMSQPSVSADGQRLAFASYADDLVPNDSNGTEDVFVHNQSTGVNVLVSVGTDGNAAAGGFSCSPVLSADGRFVAFLSTATNLVANQSNRFLNLFRRDLQTQTTILVSISTNGVSPGDGDSSSPILSADGRYVAFWSKARNLAPGLVGIGPYPFWRDLTSGLTVSLAGNSVGVFPPSMSADGRFVAYCGPSVGTSTQLLVWDAQQAANIYTNSVSPAPVALSATGGQLAYQLGTRTYGADLGNGSNLFAFDSQIPIRSPAQWSGDGRFFAFVSATNAAPGVSNRTNNVFLFDLVTGTATLVSVNFNRAGSANGSSDWPVVNGDGRFVVFRSLATDLAPGTTNTGPNIFIFDRLSGSNRLLTAQSLGSSWSTWLSRPAISSDGQSIAFQSWAGYAADDLNRVQDIFAAWVPSAPISSNPVPAFRLQISVMVPATNGATLTWPAVPGKSYQVQSKANLQEALWHSAVGNAWVVGDRGYFALSAAGARFFRIVALDN